MLLPYEDSEQSDRDNEMESDGSRKSDKGSDSISIVEIDRDEVEDVRTIYSVPTPFSFSFSSCLLHYVPYLSFCIIYSKDCILILCLRICRL